ncbi:sulfatase-like hydrolase/transferase [Rhodopirellula sp. ICT_H3.1]|uniref:Sulfatase-like hydrolase/transferase n=1 Tax=Aporhodopirellula aestuarii TaxID=2950107 RepID=A0ABT0TX29_9BACT|nr:sulfatase-like hydrolase/transferase [Aporhodopirellula aestuarii]
MKTIHRIGCAIFAFAFVTDAADAAEKPNIILVYADDISARELPIYGSSVWSQPTRGDTSDESVRAKTPVLDQMAEEGCWVKTAWASVVCSPSRAMMMTGRYAHLHKWWNNKDKGLYVDDNGKAVTWPLYKSSPMLIGHVARQAGYGTYWAGKTQMAGDLREFGFDQGCFTPGNLSDTDNPYTDFKMYLKKVDGTKVLLNADTDQPLDTYQQHGWYFYPHVRLMNHDDKAFQWWPNTPDSIKNFGVGTYGPDVELDFIFDFMHRQHAQDQPFFVYHTTHLGHDAFNWLDPDSESSWPGTPKISWDGNGYTRTQPHITGDEGDYDTHGTVSEPGIHSHINYLDYQMWLYRNKLKEMGIEDNTVIIFCADNGTSGYGKNSSDRQKGTHVPLIIYAPGMTKHGEQDVLVNMSDMLPTIAELAGVEIPEDYEVNGESLVPFLYTDKPKHRDWIYAYSREQQMIRGEKVMRDGPGRWWDVSKTPDDLISFEQIDDWDSVSEEHRVERDLLKGILPQFDLHATQRNAPGFVPPSADNAAAKKANAGKNPKPTQATMKTLPANPNRVTRFADDFEGRTEVGPHYMTALGAEDAWTIVDGALIGKQTRDDHGAVIRTEMKFADIDLEFDFRFNGGSRFNLVMDDKHEKSVHAGHICRVSITPKKLTLSDDKIGGMNLKVREQRQDKNLSVEDKQSLDALLAKTQSSASIAVKPGEWHRLRARIRGDIMAVFLDGEKVAALQSPGFAHPTKTKYGFTVNGATIDFDNVNVFSTPQE